jgi:hypothetical protein
MKMHIHGGQESCVSFCHRDNRKENSKKTKKNCMRELFKSRWESKKQRNKENKIPKSQNPTIGNSCFYWVCTQLQHHPCCLKWNVGVALQSTERDGSVNEKWLLLFVAVICVVDQSSHDHQLH